MPCDHAVELARRMSLTSPAAGLGQATLVALFSHPLDLRRVITVEVDWRSGPGLAVGSATRPARRPAACAVVGPRRRAITLMGVTAFWTAVHCDMPLLVDHCANKPRSYLQ